MKTLKTLVAGALVMLACSTASAAFVKVGPVTVGVRTPAARRAYVAPRPVARATVRHNVHERRENYWDRREAFWDAVLP